MLTEKDLRKARTSKEECTEINEEFVIADYQTEIRKILSCRETLSPPTQYVDGDGVDVCGKVNYKILYLGADNCLYIVSFDSEYAVDMKIETGDASDSPQGRFSVHSDSLSVRQLSPKRISVRNRICAHVSLSSLAEKSECMTEAFLPDGCEALTSAVPSLASSQTTSDVFELVDEVISNIGAEFLRVIGTDKTIFVSDVTCSNEEATVRGELVADLLITNDESAEMPKVIRRKIPFTQSVALHCANTGSPACANATCEELSATVEGDRILLTAYCTVTVTAFCEQECSVCTDIYSPANELTVRTGKLQTEELLCCGNGNISVGGSFGAKDVGIEGGSRILYATGTATPEALTFYEESGRPILSGTCRFRMITVNDSKEVLDYDQTELTLPFRYEVTRESKVPADKDAVDYCASADLSRISARFDGERLGLDAELSLSFWATEKKNTDVVCDVIFGEKKEQESGTIKILYPTADDTLWKVGKRTSSPLEHLCEINGIKMPLCSDSADSLAGKRFMIL